MKTVGRESVNQNISQSGENSPQMKYFSEFCVNKTTMESI